MVLVHDVKHQGAEGVQLGGLRLLRAYAARPMSTTPECRDDH